MTPNDLRAAGHLLAAAVLERNPDLEPIIARVLAPPIHRLHPIEAAGELHRTAASLRAASRARLLLAWQRRLEDAPDDADARAAIAALVARRRADERSGLVAPRVPVGQPPPAPPERKALPFRPRRFR
jgi:hypothetical protein